MKTEWELSVCPICGEEKPELEEGEIDLTVFDPERDDEGYLICDGAEEHEPVRFETITVVSKDHAEQGWNEFKRSDTLRRIDESRLKERTAKLEAALETLADRKRWADSNTGAVNWLHLDGKTKPYEIAQTALLDGEREPGDRDDDHP